MSSSIFDLNFQLTRLNGATEDLASYRNRVLLIVNTASLCGFTPQYQGLEELYRKYQDRGLTVLGFPCNQFGHQEPEGEAAIGQFCQVNYGVTFPLFAKTEVNGPQANPLFVWLKKELPGLLGLEAVKWNFTKFLLDRRGRPYKRFAPQTKPQDLIPEIERLLTL